MKIFWFHIVVIGSLLGASAAPTNSMTSALQQGLFEEEANNNLEAAIQAYKSVVTQFDRDRKLAATAIYRLGECYRKQGKTNEAVANYTRILSEFSDLASLATLSRRSLTGFGTTVTAATTDSSLQAAAPVTSAEEEEIRRIRAMIANSPDLINTPRGGQTPLHQASVAGQLVVTRFLLENGADVNTRTPTGSETPLHLAALGGHRNLAQLLIEHGADLNARSKSGMPLHIGAQNGFAALVEVLLKAGADPMARMDSGASPLHLAARAGHRTVSELLLDKGAEVNAVSKDGTTPLHEAVAGGHAEMVQLLLKRGAQINAAAENGKTPLFVAVENHHMEAAKLLLTNKANPNTPSEAKGRQVRVEYPLHRAILDKSVEMAGLLLESGADPNAILKDRERLYPPLNLAMELDFSSLVLPLLEHKADPNLKKMPEEETPLVAAIKKSLEKAALSLIEHKADVNIPDATGNTALHYSLSQPEIFRAIIAAGGNVNARNKVNQTPLHWAASSGLEAQVLDLIKRQAAVNVRDESGLTPLHMAVLAQNKSMVALLLRNGADPNQKDSDGATPLDLEKASARMSTYTPVRGISVPGMPRVAVPIPADGYRTSVSTGSRPVSEIGEMLRQHGAQDLLPDTESIKVGRTASGQPQPILERDPNNWNQFTLMELVGVTYGFLDSNPAGSPRISGSMNNVLLSAGRSHLSFPELSRLNIRQPDPKGGWTNRVVNLTAILESGDCSQDIPLNWGEVVDIPETDHLLNETWRGFSTNTIQALDKCWRREVEIIVKGRKTNVVLEAEKLRHNPTQTLSMVSNARFWIRPVLQNSKLLLASSDLTRVKVTRNEKDGTQKTLVIDCSEDKPAPAFWLRDGDVIEVPDK